MNRAGFDWSRESWVSQQGHVRQCWEVWGKFCSSLFHYDSSHQSFGLLSIILPLHFALVTTVQSHLLRAWRMTLWCNQTWRIFKLEENHSACWRPIGFSLTVQLRLMAHRRQIHIIRQCGLGPLIIDQRRLSLLAVRSLTFSDQASLALNRDN